MQALELKIPPVVLVALFALAMWVVTPWLPALALPVGWRLLLAGFFAAAGVAIALAGVLAFRRANTTVDPRVPEQSSSLVVRGIYRYSRNPMYVGFLLLLTALGCYLMSAAAFALLPLFVWYMNRFQIAPEERFLRQKFGADYQAYCKSVRRWL
ncbi:MAG: isoprenylcysteine carboxylmethyltransferase family protein [Gammaproteobacteria bacterium]|nr:isoprenylcysteine carboxylmethyltransferase family protein [Gammaproteobacteria bacterium]MBU2181482.1 isoprenylcysteine carboxylmethyltransferase family protein [Gammaproteobacteria bacterium]MBU2203538.1 isoprenylcysteine carboxylmethyltransferase family protein [Gammaproteobacteria bacterium]